MESYKGYGAILGDMIASPYEFKNRIRSREFEFFNPECHFTDDTIMTIATMDAILNNKSYGVAYKEWGNRYFGDYYGAMFKDWLQKPGFEPNDSWGNGTAMRSSPIGYVYTNFDECQREAVKSAECSHSNKFAILGAHVMADYVRKLYLGKRNKYSTQHSASLIYPAYPKELVPFTKFDASCNGTVPVAIKVFFEGQDYEDIIRTTVSLGGDVDTIASMACELQYAYTGEMDEKYVEYVEENLPEDMLAILKQFNIEYPNEGNREKVSAE